MNWLCKQFFTLSSVFSWSWLSFRDLDHQVGHWSGFDQEWGPSLLYPALRPARNFNQIPQICPVSLILPARIEKIMNTSYQHNVPFSYSLEYIVLFYLLGITQCICNWSTAFLPKTQQPKIAQGLVWDFRMVSNHKTTITTSNAKIWIES